MERSAGRAASDGRPDALVGADAAVRDATAILARAAADAAAADAARERSAAERMPPLEPDARIGPLLAPDELVLAVRHSTQFDRRHGMRLAGAPLGLAGDLYVTTSRIVLVGRVILSIGLPDVEEIGVSGERVLLVLRDGSSISLQTSQPRLLRVEIGFARGRLDAPP